MHRDAGVSEDRLRPGGCDADRGRGIRGAGRLVQQVIPDRPERARLRCRDDLEVGQAGPTSGAPVDERLVAVGQALAVQARERLADGTAGVLVHREAEATPVARSADPALLRQDQVPRLADEAPHPLEVAIAAQAGARLALRRDDPVQDHLGRDAGMVQARQEEGRPALHPRVARHQVLDRAPLGVAEMEAAGHVRGRLDQHEGRLRRIGPRSGAVGREDVGRQPALVDRPFDLRGPVCLREPRAGLPLRHRTLPPQQNNPARPSGRTGSWYHLLVRLPGRDRSSRPVRVTTRPAALSARYRAPPVTTRERRSRRGLRAARTVPRSLRPLPALLLPVTAVRPGV